MMANVLANVTQNVTSPGSHSVTINITETTQGATFNVYRVITGAAFNYAVPIATGVAGPAWVDVGPFVEGTSYDYELTAVVNGVQSAVSNKVSALIPTLPIPPSISVGPIT